MAKDLLVTLEDRPGTLALVGETLGSAGINIEGLAGFGDEGRGLVHLLVEDGTAARTALEGAGVKVDGESDVIVLPITDDMATPGTLGRQARKIADAGVNLRFLYMASGNRIVIGADDLDAARTAMMP